MIKTNFITFFSTYIYEILAIEKFSSVSPEFWAIFLLQVYVRDLTSENFLSIYTNFEPNYWSVYIYEILASEKFSELFSWILANFLFHIHIRDFDKWKIILIFFSNLGLYFCLTYIYEILASEKFSELFSGILLSFFLHTYTRFWQVKNSLYLFQEYWVILLLNVYIRDFGLWKGITNFWI